VAEGDALKVLIEEQQAELASVQKQLSDQAAQYRQRELAVKSEGHGEISNLNDIINDLQEQMGLERQRSLDELSAARKVPSAWWWCILCPGARACMCVCVCIVHASVYACSCVRGTCACVSGSHPDNRSLKPSKRVSWLRYRIFPPSFSSLCVYVRVCMCACVWFPSIV
jgi:hypothetical protein